MDQRGSLVDTNLKIYPSEKFITFIKTIAISDDIPINILKYIKGNVDVTKIPDNEEIDISKIQFTNEDMDNLKRIKKAIADNIDNNIGNAVSIESTVTEQQTECSLRPKDKENQSNVGDDKLVQKENKDTNEKHSEEKRDELYLTTSDIDWVYLHINKRKIDGEENIPFLHELFQGTEIAVPENRVIKRNPILEARCVKLRAQQEAREYRKMTKGVDNVRMRFPEDSISYQLKQLNRQLIAIGQFIISIFAGFLFGFRGVEWMVGNLDFGVRLLLGVMCALIIALAEIYFLAKKLNEELTMTETVQIGGPPKFANQPDYGISKSTISTTDDKEHQD